MKITIEIELEELNLALAALARLPYEQVAPLIVKLREQGERQFKAAEAPQ